MKGDGSKDNKIKMFFIWLRKPRKTHTQFPEFENRGRLPAFFYSAITAIMTKSIQSLEIQSLCPTRLIYALKCLPRFHISALAKTICCENCQPACLQYVCFLIQTSINISAKVLLLSWRQHEGYGPPGRCHESRNVRSVKKHLAG